MKEEVLSLLNEQIPSWKNRVFYVGISGGIDSVTSLLLLNNLGAKCVAMHVNYQLRGNDSNLDQIFVEKLTEENEIPLFVKVVEHSKLKDKFTGNLQEIARRIRRNYFQEIMETCEVGKPILVLGHNQNDQAETLLMNLDRQSGILGLAGMLQFQEKKEFDVFRPILDFNRTEILKFATFEKQMWREDLSNQMNKYYRNFLRNEVLSKWSEKKPEISENLAKQSQVFQIIQQELELRINEILISGERERNFYCNQQAWKNLMTIEKIELLRRFNFANSAILEIEKLFSSEVGKKIENSSCEVILVKNNELVFWRKVLLISQELIVSEEKKNDLINFSNPKMAYVDASKIAGKLTLRAWKEGDKMQPFGMKGSKLISDLIVDLKIPSFSKKGVQVVCDDEKIVWLVPHRISELVKVDEKSIHILALQLKSASSFKL